MGGFDIVEHPIEARRLIGYLPENAPAYTDMTVYGFLNFAAEIRGLRGDAKKQAVSRVVEMCFLECGAAPERGDALQGLSPPHLFRPVHHSRPGRAGAGRADRRAGPEPEARGAAVDPRMGEKKAIIFSTHILEEVDAACTRAIIIDRGKIVANGTPQELRQNSEWAGAVTLRVKGVAASAVTTKLYQVPLVKQVTVVEEKDGRVTVRAFPKSEANGDAGAGHRRGGRTNGRSSNCRPRKAGWTKCSAASPCRTPAKEAA